MDSFMVYGNGKHNNVNVTGLICLGIFGSLGAGYEVFVG